MLRFATRPDEVFTELVDDALSMGRDMLEFVGPELDFHWLDTNTWKIFGASAAILIMELSKLIEANKSPDLFMPTDYHFRLLDRVLEWYCVIYNDENRENTKNAICYKGTPIPFFDIDLIRSDFFWDLDYNFVDTLGPDCSEQTQLILKEIGVTKSGRNMQQGKPADSAEFTLTKCEPDQNWDTVDDIGDGFWFGDMGDDGEFDDDLS
jgi:hypothetical protein